MTKKSRKGEHRLKGTERHRALGIIRTIWTIAKEDRDGNGCRELQAWEVEYEFKRKYPGDRLPKRRTVNQYIAKVLEEYKQIPEEVKQKRRKMDAPWNLDALRDSPLPPETLPAVFKIWLTKQVDPLSPPLSIREAGWIAQLATVADDTDRLQIVAEICAECELIGEIIDIPQLSSPAMVLYAYSRLTKMTDQKLKEHHQEILKGKQVSGTRRKQIMAELASFYGEEFIRTIKDNTQLKAVKKKETKTEEEEDERTFGQKKLE